MKKEVEEQLEAQLEEEILNDYSNELTTTERILIFQEMCRRGHKFDVFMAQKLLAQVQFDRLVNSMVNGIESITDDKIKVLDKSLNDLAKLEIERHTKKFIVTGEVVDNSSSQQRVKDEYIQKWGEKTANVLNNPDSKRRVMNILERFRAGANGVVAEVLKNNEIIEAEKN